MTPPRSPDGPVLSIVLAVQGGEARVPEIVRGVAGALGGGTELIVCAPAGAGAGDASRGAPSVRFVPSPAGALTPHLWRDGILASRAERVALTTAHCAPSAAWIAGLRAADLETYAAVGGSLFDDPESSPSSRAIYILRFAKYAPDVPQSETWDLPGDNVVYHREKLMAYAADFRDGFWEVAINRRMQREGHRLLFDPRLRLMHRNAYSPLEFARQRFEHGTHFGRTRAASMKPLTRAAYLAASPAVPAVLGSKVLRRTIERRQDLWKAAGALPYFSLYLHAWAAGEAMGIWRALTSDQEN